MGTLLQDLRYGLRVLRKSPGFTFAAVVTLALAIGANAVVFSVMNALVLRPLNVPDAHSLYALWRVEAGGASQSYPDFLDLRERNRSFEDLAAFSMDEDGVDIGNGPSDVWLYETSTNYFDALHVQPYLGRFFHASDEHGPDSTPYVVLSYDYWHTHFQQDPGVIGRVVQIDKRPFTIIGVAPPGFHGTLLFFNPDFFVPILNHGPLGHDDLNQRGTRWIFMVVGHLKPGVTNAQAVADLGSIALYLQKTYPKDDGKLQLGLAHPALYGDFIERPARAFMAALMLLAILILLAACANLGSLFAARAADRAREVALRLALGSTRSRLLRGLFTEALLIAGFGGVIGLWGSVVLLHALSVWKPMPRFPIYMPVNPDAHVYAVAVLLTIVSGLLFGAVPVRQVLRTSPYEVVKAGSIFSVGRRVTVRDVLLVVQIALCALLVTASFVAVRGMARTLHNNVGFAVDNVMLADTDLRMANYSGEHVWPIEKRMIDALATLPGVDAVGLADGLPLAEGASDSTVFRDDTPDLSSANAAGYANLYRVTPEYFRAAGTMLLAGRGFTWHDDKNAPCVAVVNREFARHLFGSSDHAIGRYFKMPDGNRIQVVGIAEDGKYNSLTEDPQLSMFLPILQSPASGVFLVVHSELDPQKLGPMLRSRLREIDPELLVAVQTRRQAMDIALFGPHMATISLGVLGVLGAILSVTGIFGMAAYSVSKRLRELGIRIALGAQRKEVLQAALGRAFKLLAFGSVAGLILGILASRVLASVVYQATPRDPLVLAGAVLTMLLLGLVATWIPARRALKVDPLVLLRVE